MASPCLAVHRQPPRATWNPVVSTNIMIVTGYAVRVTPGNGAAWTWNAAAVPIPAPAGQPRRRRPRGGGRKPADARAVASGESCTVSPSAFSTVIRPSAPSLTAAASAAAHGSSTDWSSLQDSRVLPPRSTYSTSSPPLSTTTAPALRPGRCEVAVSPGRAGHGSAAPYGCAGSAAARTTVRSEGSGAASDAHG